MSQNYLNIDRFIYGGDYNSEQWLDRPDIFKQDLLLMKKAHINTVTLDRKSTRLNSRHLKLSRMPSSA